MTATVLAPFGPPATPPGDDAPLGVVVVSYGSAELLRRNLAPAGLPGPDVRVVVVDNFSSQANRRAVEELGAASGWHVVGMPDNRGFGAACNAGVAVARELGCRTFLFLNPDAVITPAVVAELRAQSLHEPLSVISPRLLSSDGEVVFLAARTDLRDGRVRRRPSADGPRTDDPGDWLCGACVVVHDELFTRIGGYDEGYFLYWEDVDLGYRAVAAGATVVLREDLVAVHDEGGTHGEGRRGSAKSALYYRWNCRNRLAFAARHLDRRALLRWVRATPAVSWEILLRGGRRQLLQTPSVLWAVARGALEGLVRVLPALVLGPRRPLARPRVLVVHPGAELYGSDRVLLESVGALLRDSEVTVALPGHGPLVAELEGRGARVVVRRMPVLRKAVLRPAGSVRLLADALLGLPSALALLRTAPAVHVNTTVLPSWLLLARLARRRVVCHVHEAEWPGPAVLQRLLLRTLLAADVVVANSRFTAEVLIGLVPALAGRTAVVANPVPAPVDAVPARERLDSPVRLLFVGRLSPRKGPDVAIRALRVLLDRGVDARLTVAGSVFEGYEWFADELWAEVTASGLADRVELLGFRDDVWPLLRGADVVLVPSTLDESFGNAAVEAVLAARPVVVSDLPGLREAVDGFAAARVAEPGRPERWADAVAGLVADWPGARSAALDDAARARERHAVHRFAAGLLEAAQATGTVAR
ncbi:glycosyltransferase [Geodermatophilus sp. DSM 45219]|uniref:glycosyltransferase n=1 Tax=Geodermatophilus sp. DSM 45219 TaxID=1881103 RepID=UPI00088322F8|nr:glycosyltransferase [Geodermatophilus sp. DSM 45219]SDN45372.1 Glycosyltransferase, GT2 family [Geodermatophilus sp. DSM 45219]